jgi:hypothetical protein
LNRTYDKGYYEGMEKAVKQAVRPVLGLGPGARVPEPALCVNG